VRRRCAARPLNSGVRRQVIPGAEVPRVVLLTVVLAALVSGCVAGRHSCAIPEGRREGLLQDTSAKIAELSNDNDTFDLSQALTSDNHMHRLADGRCYVYLSPVSLKGQGILDGDGGIYVDPTTMKLGDVFWFRY
jgi:hypothetical protein